MCTILLMGAMRRVWDRVVGATFSTDQDPAPRSVVEVFAQLYDGVSGAPISREAALSVPAMLKARNLIASTATLPLRMYDADDRRVPSRLLDQIDPDVPNGITIAQTVEDLLLEAVSWWRITEWAGGDPRNYPVSARRLWPGSVTLRPRKERERRTDAPLPSTIDPRDADVYVDGVLIRDPERHLIRFDSPNPALLRSGARALRRALLIDRTASRFAGGGRPLAFFKPSDGVDPADDDEIREILRDWEAALKRHATPYIPAALEYVPVDTPSPADLQLIELARDATLGVAAVTGLDPEDLGVSTTSRTYQNAVDRRKDRINDVFSPYMNAIAQRLTMNDVTPRGYRADFDLDDYLRADPITRATYYQIMEGIGALSPAEIRDRERIPGPPPPRPAAPAAGNVTPIRAGRRPAGHAFSDAGARFHADPVTESFAVDRARRTIRGLVVPYAETAVKGGRRYQFMPGSLTYAELSRVKLLRDHDHAQAVGVATLAEETPRGLEMEFRVATGPAGDAVLALAAEGVLDGLSPGVDFDETAGDARRVGNVYQVFRSIMREVSLTAMPAFDGSRVTSVTAHQDQNGGQMHCQTCGQIHADGVACPSTPAPAAAPAPALTLSADQFSALVAHLNPPPAPAAAGSSAPAVASPEDQRREFAQPGRQAAEVTEGPAYRFTRKRSTGEVQFLAGEHDFATDVVALARRNELEFAREASPEARRVNAWIREQFDIDSADVTPLNPTIQRPDMYVDQREYRRPIWEFIGRGAPPNGIQPFTFPKYVSSSGLVGDHTEGVEPTGGTLVLTTQTVTPSALSGKAELTRETWDMGGNPAVSSVIWEAMRRGYSEGLESAAATFLNTLTAAADITLGVAATDAAFVAAWEDAITDLQFIRGYDFSAFVAEKITYKKFASAKASDGRPFYPQIGPSNVNGGAARRWRTLDLGGVEAVPSWALASTAGALNSSWLFDPTTVYGWATPPQRLDLPGTKGTAAAPVAYVDIAIWGYKAFANTDIGGVRQVTYDNAA